MYYNYSFEMPMERDFDPVGVTQWMQENWTLSIKLSVAYIASIYIGQWWMKNAKPFDLQWPLFFWNLGLAAFSIVGCLRMTPEFMWALFGNSFEYSMCVTSYARGVAGYWTTMFAYSKVVEFGDTAFIVLRKRPLTFLHWFHHITVLVYTWHAFQEHTASGRWFIWMNYTVHAVMYSYYAVRSFGVRGLPKFIPLMITIMQLMQMVGGIVICVNSYRLKFHAHRPCQQSLENLMFNVGIYVAYFILFANYFTKSYLSRSGKHTLVVAEEKKAKKEKYANGAVANGHIANGKTIKAE